VRKLTAREWILLADRVRDRVGRRKWNAMSGDARIEAMRREAAQARFVLCDRRTHGGGVHVRKASCRRPTPYGAEGGRP
jgi:hypothetical protein